MWHETAGDDWTPRPALPGDTDVDVAVVGAGLTGLWTAHYLAEADPSLRIVVLEAETVGYGASGRNGGWCSALFPASLDALAAQSDRAAALAQDAAMRDSVREVARAADELGIDPTDVVDLHTAGPWTVRFRGSPTASPLRSTSGNPYASLSTSPR